MKNIIKLTPYFIVILLGLTAGKCVTMNKTKETTINYNKNGNTKETKKP